MFDRFLTLPTICGETRIGPYPCCCLTFRPIAGEWSMRRRAASLTHGSLDMSVMVDGDLLLQPMYIRLLVDATSQR